MTEFEIMKEYFQNAKLGSFLLVPLKYNDDSLSIQWLENNGKKLDFNTMDINESVKKTINGTNTANVITRYKIPKEKVYSEIFGDINCGALYACEKNTNIFTVENSFDLSDIEIYIFHTQVAFLCVKIRYSKVKLLDTICNLGYVENNVDYYYTDGTGEKISFDFQQQLIKICAYSNLEPFFSKDCSLFLEAYTYTTALVAKRFEKIETMRQAAFNLHLMVEPDMLVEDESEQDINFVYSVKDQTIGSYRWGCCVTSQTISYIVADSDMDIDYEMNEQSENGLPVVLLALYQKYTCLRFNELISITDDNKSKRLKQLIRQLLEFQAYGTIKPANISRWHNIRQTYKHILDTNGVPEAIEDISITLNLLADRQKEIESAKSDAIMGLITIFSIVSIPSSIIGLIDLLMGGNSFNVITTVISLVSIVLIITVLALYKERS